MSINLTYSFLWRCTKQNSYFFKILHSGQLHINGCHWNQVISGLNPTLLCDWMKLMAQPITALNPNILGFMAAICVQLSSMQYFEKKSCFTCYNATGINNSSINQWIFINGLNTQINTSCWNCLHTIHTLPGFGQGLSCPLAYWLVSVQSHWEKKSPCLCLTIIMIIRQNVSLTNANKVSSLSYLRSQ